MDVVRGSAYACKTHRFLCGDLEAGDWSKALALIDRPAMVVYSDPPWNAGNCRYWRSRAGLDRGPVKWPDFAARFCDAVAACEPDVVFVEQAMTGWESFVRIADAAGLPSFSGCWTCFYGAPINTGDRMAVCRRPNKLLRFARHEWKGNPEGLRAEMLVRHVFAMEPTLKLSGVIVADPCVGKGTTARVAERFGITCLGMEINPLRLSTTLSWFEKKGVKVERIE